VESLETGFASPVTYGTVPAGATQLAPLGAPAALASGDTVSVEMSGTGADGYRYSGSGSFTLP
jgi:hypothetical protein